MRYKKIITLFISINVCIGINSIAQISYTFKQFTTEDGLSNNTVTDIEQDLFGRIWLATYDGITCYDGINFKSIRHDPLNPNESIPHNEAINVEVDCDGRVWVQFDTGKLVRIIDITGKCKHYSIESAEFKLQKNVNGQAEILLKNKYYQYNPSSDKFDLFAENLKVKDEHVFAVSNAMQKLYPDIRVDDIAVSEVEKNVWVATRNYGLMFIPNGDYTNIHQYWEYTDDPDSRISSNEVYSVMIDREGLIWSGTKDGGVNVGRKKKDYFSELSSLNHANFPEATIRSIIKDKKENLWVGAYDKGLAIFSKDDFKAIEFKKTNDLDHWNWIRSLYQTSDGYIWVGSYAGLCRINPISFEKKYFEPSINNTENSISIGRIYSMCEDNNGNMYIGEWGALTKYNSSENQFTRIDIHTDLKDQKIRKLHVSTKGELWVGTEAKGVFVLDTSDFSINRRYYAGAEVGFELNSNSIFEITETTDGNFYVGNFGGLNYISKSGKSNKLMWLNQKLPSTLVYKIYEDKAKQLWCSTTKGIVKINISKKDIRVYDKNEGSVNLEFSEGAGFMDNSGNIYLGGANGITYFHPDSIPVSNYLPHVFVPGYTLNGEHQSVEFGKKNLGSEYIFHYWERHISLEIQSVLLQSPNKTSMAYKLEPYDSEFIISDGSWILAEYENLSPGNYRLHAKTSNADGIWDEEKEIFSFTIEKPFWMEYYFYLLILSFLGLSIFLIIRYRFVSIKKKNEQLEHLVQNRTCKIEKQKKELEQANNALEQKNAEVMAQHDQILAQRDHLIEMHEKLARADELKLKFFTNISHDIRTPLTLIAGPLEEMLRSNDIPQKLLPKLKRMQKNSAYILKLLNQVLDKKKLEVGGLQPVFTHGDLVYTCESVLNSFSDQANQNKVKLTFQSSINEYYARYDHDKLQQIVFNLVANAIKFTPAGGEIKVDVIFYSRDFEIKISDTGIGISENRIQHIFDRYYQINKLDSNEGVGIGLSLVKDYIGILEGEINVESEENKGSCFNVKLPLHNTTLQEIFDEHQDSLQLDSRVETSSDNTKVKTDANAVKLVLVEDNQDLRQYLVESLSQKYDVESFINGKEALAYLKKHHQVGIILSDWMMPEMDGIELCKTIKKKASYQTVPFILLTALSEINNQKEGYNAGIDEYISKPFDMELLHLKIDCLLKRGKQISRSLEVEAKMQPENLAVVTHDDKLLKRIRQLVEGNMSDTAFGQNEMAMELGLSQMQLYRKLKELTQMSPNEFIRSIRIKRAAQLLENEGLIVNEVSYLVGFNDPKYFSRCFSKEMGISPKKFREEKSKNSNIF